MSRPPGDKRLRNGRRLDGTKWVDSAVSQKSVPATKSWWLSKDRSAFVEKVDVERHRMSAGVFGRVGR